MTIYILTSLIIIGVFIYYQFYKPNTFKFKKVIPFLIVFGILTFLDIRFRINNYQFYEKGFQSVVVESQNYRKEESNYILNNEMTLYSIGNEFDIRIGDLIIKTTKTNEYKVYRKNEFGIYRFVHRYQYVP